MVGDAQEIYHRRLPVTEALDRIETYYKPYHQALRRLMSKTHRRFGVALLVDCHSMPSGPIRDESVRADFVLGDRYGTSCAPLLTETLEHELAQRGYVVVRNKPYAGGYITEHYGNPAAGLHAVQIEINRGLYMEEATYSRGANFYQVRADLDAVSRRLMEVVGEELAMPRAAAE